MINQFSSIDPLTPFELKKTKEFGLQVARLISHYWFSDSIIQSGTKCEFNSRKQYIINKRKFVRNEVSPEHLKKRLFKTKTDHKYLNLSFKTKNIARKFTSTVINGISDENYILDIMPTDHLTVKIKNDREFEYRKRMATQPLLQAAKRDFGLDFNQGEFIPSDEEELQIQLEIKDRPKIKIAEEILINFIKETNDWNVIEYQKNKDLVEIGISVIRVYTDKNDGVKIAYVDPENYVHSYNHNSPNFKDKFYEGVVETITISDLIRESNFSDEDVRGIAKNYGFKLDNDNPSLKDMLNHKVQVLRFAYKTSKRMVYKEKLRNGSVYKLTKKDESYINPPSSDVGLFESIFDTWFEGNYVIGTELIYGWQECENMFDDIMNKAMSPYITFATDIYQNNLSSFTDPIEELSDELNFISLKIQHLTSELKPDLTVINEDALAEISDGPGNSKREAWESALDLMGARGVIFEKTINLGDEGDIQKATAARPYAVSQGGAITILLNEWAFYYNQLRENTGINPARDGALPGDALVGVTQMMQLSSNMVTKNIADAAMEMNRKICEVISTRINSIYRYKEANKIREIYNNVIGKHMMSYIDIMKNRHLHEFGFIFRMIPTREDIQRFREDLSISLQSGLITVDIKSEAEYIYRTNPELARQYLNYNIRKENKRKYEEQIQLSRIKSENDAKAAQAKAQAEGQSYQFKKQVELDIYGKMRLIDLDFEQGKIEINMPKEEKQFERDVYLERIKSHTKVELEDFKENRKDDRTKLQASQQSKMVSQRQNNSNPIDFENEYNFDDIINYPE